MRGNAPSILHLSLMAKAFISVTDVKRAYSKMRNNRSLIDTPFSTS